MHYKDYYETLGVPRTATQDDIRKTYRKLARKYHPDVNKSAGAQAKFQDVAEAYEVLGDPDKRKKYDELGANWQNGQTFTPPPGWESFRFEGQPAGFGRDAFAGGGGSAFSDFFEALFGGHGGGHAAPFFGHGADAMGAGHMPGAGADQEAVLTISLEDAYRGATRHVALQAAGPAPRGHAATAAKTYDVRIPKGIRDGQRIRLRGQVPAPRRGQPAGDLYLRIQLAPHPRYRVRGGELEVDVPITPWEAALGGKVRVPTLDGGAMVNVPPGTSSGAKMRLRGKGLPAFGNEPTGDLIAMLTVAVPKNLSAEERRLFEELARTSRFNPRPA